MARRFFDIGPDRISEKQILCVSSGPSTFDGELLNPYQVPSSAKCYTDLWLLFDG